MNSKYWMPGDPPLESTETSSNSFIFNAVRNGNIHILRSRDWSELNCVEGLSGHSLLYVALSNGQVEISKWLLYTVKVDPIQSTLQQTPMYGAVLGGIYTVSVMLEYSRVTGVKVLEIECIEFCIRYNKFIVLQLLLEECMLESRDTRLVDIALECGHVHIVYWLVTVVGVNAEQCMFNAIYSGNIVAVGMLRSLGYGNDVTLKECCSGKSEMLKILNSKSCDIPTIKNRPTHIQLRHSTIPFILIFTVFVIFTFHWISGIVALLASPFAYNLWQNRESHLLNSPMSASVVVGMLTSELWIVCVILTKSQLEFNTVRIAFFVFYSVCAVSFAFLLFMNPGIHCCKEKTSTPIKHLMSQELPDRMYCYTCRHIKCDGIKHCRECDVCVYEFDHHCIYVNGCVAGGNINVFFVFLCTLQLQIICFVGVLIDRVVDKNTIDIPEWPIYALGLAVSVLTFFVVFGLCIGTTMERWKKFNRVCVSKHYNIYNIIMK